MKRRIVILALVLSLLFTGCNSVKNSDYIKVGVSKDSIPGIDTSLLLADAMGDDICVVDASTVVNDGDTSINIGAGLLFNISDNTILYNKNIFKRMYPASTTKVLTAYCAIKYGKLYGIDFSKEIKVSGCVNNMVAGAKLSGFYEGDVLTLQDIMYCTLLESGNDAALILAENIAGSVDEFVKLMNEEAKRIGATNSHFVNPHGLFEEEHYTTAYDLYLIFNEAVKLPEFVEYINTDTYSFKYTTASGVIRNRIVTATNQYISGKSTPPDGVTVVGGKTGFEDLAGRCLVILSRKNDKEYISIVLNANSTAELYDNMNKLLSKEE